MAELKFGVLLDHQYPKDEGTDLTGRLSELRDFVHVVRDLGFDSIFGIHHYLSSLRTLQPINLMAHLIDHTGDMRIGTGVLIVPFVHPVHHAEELATLDQLSGGRLTLGVGSGYRDNEFDAFGIDRKQRSGRLRESLELMQALWTGETVNHDGRYFRVVGEQCSVVPLQPGGPPIWVGANSPGGIARAARMGHAWLAPGNVKRNWAVGNLEHYQRELEAAGMTDRVTDFPLHRDLCLADSREEAFALAEQYARRSYGEYADYGLDYFETLFEDIKRKAFFFGTPDEVSERIEDFAAAGFNHFVFRVQWLGAPSELSIGILERFAGEVLPRFRARVAA
jgi:alkanesulfonate monooxygenase SsuD/methylene tetrahydromethanopterin reductase-like flavin-dependent oxidoreductase (luciferase family)